MRDRSRDISMSLPFPQRGFLPRLGPPSQAERSILLDCGSEERKDAGALTVSYRR